MPFVSPNHVVILVDAPTTPQGDVELPPDFLRLTQTLTDAILQPLPIADPPPTVTLASTHPSGLSIPSEAMLIPLTLDVPDSLEFSGRSLYATCRDVDSLRQQVQTQMNVQVGEGSYWLPVVWTAKGPLYAEVIRRGVLNPDGYMQPMHLGDRWRQPLYRFAHQLLTHLQATPAVYLLKFGFEQQLLVFDRVFPFPDLPAIASIGVQTPDLLTCHWRCLTHQPILDVAIASPVQYAIFDPAMA
ncbi:MAG: hypothetical protein IGR76_00435 [Synechococcales cyanobacterium T60_A2020_003]|nr:hypothetical protein [Synechococcales cyanobacterium T60_A2020_003]